MKENPSNYSSLKWVKQDGSKVYSNIKSAQNAVNLWLVLYGAGNKKVSL